jgi:Predicted nucleic acid-binding protein, contains PIN domain
MTVRFSLDTNIISEPLKAKPNKGVMRNLRVHETDLAISAIVWHELWTGCYRLPQSRKRAAIESYLRDVVSSLPILPYDTPAAEWHAAERARLTALGKTPPFADGQIAAIAVVNTLVLVTSNTADFAQFRQVDVADWRKA